MGGVRKQRPTGLSLRQLRAHALALRLQHAKLSESLKMQFKAQKAEEKRRKSEASADAADAALRRRRRALRRVRRGQTRSQ
jgi:hypothetical protein